MIRGEASGAVGEVKIVTNGSSSLRHRYKVFRKRLLSYAPFIRRVRHERIVARMYKHHQYERRVNEAMGQLFFSPPPLASNARYAMPVPMREAAVDELCLFVTHAAKPDLKPHVVDHVNALIDAGIAVVLVANSDVEPAVLRLPEGLASRLYGCLVRENVGYDFAAWAHAYSLMKQGSVRRRLFFINDSIIGPLDLEAYEKLLRRIRESPADALGLTANPDPHDHLQSYYLVFNERLLHSELSDTFLRGIVNMPLKQNVIDCYEIWLSPFLEKNGFSTAAMFPKLSTEPAPNRNDTLWSWSTLIDIGFPFVKSMVLQHPIHGEAARRRIPSKYL